MTALTYKLDGRLEDGFKFSPTKLTVHGRNVLKAAKTFHSRTYLNPEWPLFPSFGRAARALCRRYLRRT